MMEICSNTSINAASLTQETSQSYFSPSKGKKDTEGKNFGKRVNVYLNDQGELIKLKKISFVLCV